jgi:hypothetical protein
MMRVLGASALLVACRPASLLPRAEAPRSRREPPEQRTERAVPHQSLIPPISADRDPTRARHPLCSGDAVGGLSGAVQIGSGTFQRVVRDRDGRCIELDVCLSRLYVRSFGAPNSFVTARVPGESPEQLRFYGLTENVVGFSPEMIVEWANGIDSAGRDFSVPQTDVSMPSRFLFLSLGGVEFVEVHCSDGPPVVFAMEDHC